MIAKYYGKQYSLNYLRDNSYITREGVSMLGLGEAADKIGLKTLAAKITMKQLTYSMPLPCILHWNNNHFVVLYKVTGKGKKCKYYVADPDMGKMVYNQKEIYKHWISSKFEDKNVGLAMQIEPGIDFHKKEDEDDTFEKKKSILAFLRYIVPHKKTILQILFGAIVTMLLSYFLPFISQAVVDFGIKNSVNRLIPL